MAEPATSADKPPPVRTGRPRVASRAELERLGFALFERQGFDNTTIDDIAAAAGIGRRTFFRYFASKNDLVWGDFEAQLTRLSALLAATPDLPMMDALRTAVVEFNRFDGDIVPWHRRRMELVLHVPALRADSTLRYRSWQALITEFVAARTGLRATDPIPRLLGHLALATSVAAYELWLEEETADLSALLDALFRRLATGFLDVPERRS
ncbi:mycofactocin system transcriptional regulator [Actinoplanes palleronii]|uniref:mycofactocin system transcriptional regulator n=1 Tax=Actinoplanes palleronii TaxID=113570 RepID=UPI0019432771|nr:mycofactocin system transcriptional regulator [Actinoplanes palleronii]